MQTNMGNNNNQYEKSKKIFELQFSAII